MVKPRRNPAIEYVNPAILEFELPPRLSDSTIPERGLYSIKFDATRGMSMKTPVGYRELTTFSGGKRNAVSLP